MRSTQPHRLGCKVSRLFLDEAQFPWEGGTSNNFSAFTAIYSLFSDRGRRVKSSQRSEGSKLLSSESAPIEAIPAVPNQPTLFGHPIGLYVLFFTEMWERFSYYGMRGLLKLYMVNYLFVASRQILRAARSTRRQSGAVFGLGVHSTFDRLQSRHAARRVCFGDLRLVHGPRLSDSASGRLLRRPYWGQRKTVFIGGALMAIGHFMMAFENWFFFALLC